MKLRGMSWAWVVVASLALGVGAGCTKANPHYCSGDAGGSYHECPDKDGGTGDLVSDHPGDSTEAGDAADGSEVGDAVDATDVMDLVPERPTCSSMSCPTVTPICDLDAGMCNACTMGDQCKARDVARPACDNGQCYECAANTDCSTATKPVCETHACRACKADTECAGPAICMEDGSCAGEINVIHLDVSAMSCNTGQDGTAAKPYCDAAMAVAALAGARDILAVHGPNAGLTVNTTLPSVLIIGKKNAGGEAPSLLVGVGAGLTVTAGNVLVRDVAAAGGTSSGSKGIVVTGSTAKVRLLRVNVSSGPGLGVQSDTGATLTMNRCIVQANGVGGLLVNGAKVTVTNSVFAMNGYGVKFNPATAGSIFESNTVVGNTGNAATCDTNSPQMLEGSIVAGFIDTCVPDHTLTTAPTFDAARPFHLTAKTPCPIGDPTPFPADDLDGDVRVTSIDCGADQFIAAH